MFPYHLKLPDVIHVFRKCRHYFLKNYRPLYVLPVAGKIYEFLIKTIFICLSTTSFMISLGVRLQYANNPISLLEILKKILGGYTKYINCALTLVEFSKAFGTISQALLIAKLYGYELRRQLRFVVFSYLSNHKERVKVFKRFRTWKNLFQLVPQGLVLKQLPFNICLNNVYFAAKSRYLQFRRFYNSFYLRSAVRESTKVTRHSISILS